jgi:peptidoglycan-associated lipoprotein
LDDPNSALVKKRSVYFDFDSYSLKTDYQPLVQMHANYLLNYPNRRVLIQGNTDDIGTSEYNLALGQKRAEAVRRALTVLGVPDSRIEAVSLGEEQPVAQCSSSNKGGQGCALNRRADILYSVAPRNSIPATPTTVAPGTADDGYSPAANPTTDNSNYPVDNSANSNNINPVPSPAPDLNSYPTPAPATSSNGYPAAGSNSYVVPASPAAPNSDPMSAPATNSNGYPAAGSNYVVPGPATGATDNSVGSTDSSGNSSSSGNTSYLPNSSSYTPDSNYSPANSN